MKRMSLNNIQFTVYASFWIVLVFSVILLPLRWVAGWLCSVLIHELGHLAGILLFKLPVYSVSVKLTGIYIGTSEMLPSQEAIVAAMGPAIGLLPVLFARCFPCTAICAVLQFGFNALPIMGFDGGRVLHAILRTFLSESNAFRCMRGLQILLLVVVLILLMHIRRNTLAVLAVIMLSLRIVAVTFPCKRGKQIVQWSK